ncbi:hypothetical protein DEU56DRAFT_911323 [Suillus clintonianus]|uniref:uncharacterized protein n=1 Tax=Suillus clintonianus TaxID=1904413 RepID=UPI001B884801|nr:uncharacterized protein DEU56DRAFT_911323 [Suillus clintonianus]KAG2141216.1 hypothetical protein DEU56DRAFT_911323 [Suillus clintonianus]
MLWTLDDETVLIDFVKVNKARAGDGMNFNKTFWNDIAVHLAGSTSQDTLHATFVVIDRVVNHLGVAWDKDCDADITPKSKTVWADIIKAPPAAKSYKTEGWPPYEKLKNILPSKAKVTNAYHPLQASITSLASTSMAVAGMSFDKVEMRNKEVALDEMENTSNDANPVDVLMLLLPSPFDTVLQSPFAPFTPGTSGMSVAAGKHKADSDEFMRTSSRPPNTSKSKVAVLAFGKVTQIGSDIRDLSTSFDHAAIVFQERTPHTIDPIPLRRQKAIIQLQKEDGLEDHQVVVVIKHFQKDVAITDSYLAIE